jgi:hypothetical protein
MARRRVASCASSLFIHRPKDSRIVAPVHVLTWRETPNGQSLVGAPIPGKLATLPYSFYLALLWVAM